MSSRITTPNLSISNNNMNETYDSKTKSKPYNITLLYKRNPILFAALCLMFMFLVYLNVNSSSNNLEHENHHILVKNYKDTNDLLTGELSNALSEIQRLRGTVNNLNGVLKDSVVKAWRARLYNIVFSF